MGNEPDPSGFLRVSSVPGSYYARVGQPAVPSKADVHGSETVLAHRMEDLPKAPPPWRASSQGAEPLLGGSGDLQLCYCGISQACSSTPSPHSGRIDVTNKVTKRSADDVSDWK